jgi:hypothetical protein
MSEVRDLFLRDLARSTEPGAPREEILARWIGVEQPLEPSAQFAEGVEVLREILPNGTLIIDRRLALRKPAEFITFHFTPCDAPDPDPDRECPTCGGFHPRRGAP